MNRYAISHIYITTSIRVTCIYIYAHSYVKYNQASKQATSMYIFIIFIFRLLLGQVLSMRTDNRAAIHVSYTCIYFLHA